MVARASWADLPKTLWTQEREEDGQREGKRVGENEREGGWREKRGAARVWPWPWVGLSLGVC